MLAILAKLECLLSLKGLATLLWTRPQSVSRLLRLYTPRVIGLLVGQLLFNLRISYILFRLSAYKVFWLFKRAHLKLVLLKWFNDHEILVVA